MQPSSNFVLWKNTRLFGLAVALCFAATLESTAQVQRYRVNPGGQYTYLPSPWLGIPGGEPSVFELDFGVSGFFNVQYDAETARLLDVDFDLSGNEMVQENPPTFAPVTADRVADWLEDRMLMAMARIPEAPPGRVFADEQHPGFRLTDHLNRTVTLHGGFDSTFVDGTGMLFDVTAVAIPEPSTLALAVLALAVGFLAVRLRRW